MEFRELSLLGASWLGLVTGWAMILVFALLILFVSMLALIPLVLDPELRENMKFWGIVLAAIAAPYLIMNCLK
jgi:hypothetical protein